MKLFQFVLQIKFKRENDPRSPDAILSSCQKKPEKKKKLRRDSSLFCSCFKAIVTRSMFRFHNGPIQGI